MRDQMRDDLRLAAEIVREEKQFAGEAIDGRDEDSLDRMAAMLDRLADMTEMPGQFLRFTITAPDGSAFDAWVRNLHEPSVGLDALVARAGWTAWKEEDTPAAPTPNGYDPLWVEAINRVLADRETGIVLSDLTDALWEKYIGPLVDAIERAAQTPSEE